MAAGNKKAIRAMRAYGYLTQIVHYNTDFSI